MTAPPPSRDQIRAVVASRPIAHRGLHDISNRVVENTLAAARAAAERGFAIEVDIQLTSDDAIVVYHDDRLERLNAGEGAILDLPLETVKAVPFHVGAERIPTLAELFETVAGRAPLIIELKGTKGRPDVDRKLTSLFIAAARGYAGPFAAMSFEPGQHLGPGHRRAQPAQLVDEPVFLGIGTRPHPAACNRVDGVGTEVAALRNPVDEVGVEKVGDSFDLRVLLVGERCVGRPRVGVGVGTHRIRSDPELVLELTCHELAGHHTDGSGDGAGIRHDLVGRHGRVVTTRSRNRTH